MEAEGTHISLFVRWVPSAEAQLPRERGDSCSAVTHRCQINTPLHGRTQEVHGGTGAKGHGCQIRQCLEPTLRIEYMPVLPPCVFAQGQCISGHATQTVKTRSVF